MSPEQRAARIRMMVLDVDGVLTDGRLYYGAQGEALKAFDVRDGHGIKMLIANGVDVALLSARSSPIVAIRASELGIRHVLQGQSEKVQGLTELLLDTGLTAADCGYAGDDLPDLPVLRAVGFAASVADASDEVRAAAHWVAPRAGGCGAVRALAEYVLRAKGIDLHAMARG
jgi:3-deoxy-D-manno-octulosonate 8-phosphate phosphatase (KDO 8-P phosphatase)